MSFSHFFKFIRGFFTMHTEHTKHTSCAINLCRVIFTFTVLQDISINGTVRNIKLFYHMEGKHLELTNLIIPGKNDSEEMIHAYLDFVEQNLSRSVPLHFSAYFPAFLYRASPPTDPGTIRRIVNLARSRGFENVHAGNI